MGMYDSVFFNCPTCGDKIEFQSKSGVCDLKRYKHTSVPAEVAEDMNSRTNTYPCDCGAKLLLRASVPRINMQIIDMSEDSEWD